MDNLQQHYLRLLQGAQKKALAGEFQECLDICFDLRLKPDLALYTRAMVCLTICNFAHYRDLPQKVAIAKDALRIAKELMVGHPAPKIKLKPNTFIGRPELTKGYLLDKELRRPDSRR